MITQNNERIRNRYSEVIATDFIPDPRKRQFIEEAKELNLLGKGERREYLKREREQIEFDKFLQRVGVISQSQIPMGLVARVKRANDLAFERKKSMEETSRSLQETYVQSQLDLITSYARPKRLIVCVPVLIKGKIRQIAEFRLPEILGKPRIPKISRGKRELDFEEAWRKFQAKFVRDEP